ncbi:MAG: hypothetical protein Roseis2KO_44890 [Roseivirga sp.]
MPSIIQAIKTTDPLTFKVTDNSINIADAPLDCDWSRWGMLDDRKSTRMYCFKKGTPNQLYQFLLTDGAYTFEKDFLLTIEDLNASLNTDKIAMLSTPNFEEVVGITEKSQDPDATDPLLPIPNNYHVYLQEKGKPELLNQFILKDGTQCFNSNGITRAWFGLKDFPQDTDWDRWTMTYDSNHYQLSLPAYVFYAFRKGSNDTIYFGRYGAHGDQEVTPETDPKTYYDVYSYNPKDQPEDAEGDQYYGQPKCGNIRIEGLDPKLSVTDLCVVFNGIDTYLYLLTEENR